MNYTKLKTKVAKVVKDLGVAVTFGECDGNAVFSYKTDEQSKGATSATFAPVQVLQVIFSGTGIPKEGDVLTRDGHTWTLMKIETVTPASVVVIYVLEVKE